MGRRFEWPLSGFSQWLAIGCVFPSRSIPDAGSTQMKHLIVLGTCAVGAMGLSTALLGTGVAAADYDGQTYADAAAAIEESGGTPIIARVGSQRPRTNASSPIHKTIRI